MSNKWLPVPGYEGQYEVSDDGQVKTLSNRWGREAILRPSLTRSGHPQVVLTRDGKRWTYRVHTLMAAAFIGPRPNHSEVRHINGVPDDNRIENLAYGTHGQNTLDSVGHGTHNMARKTHCKHGHEFSPENTRVIYRRGGSERICRACARDRAKGGGRYRG